jgi:hypothetical protein
LVIDGKAPPTVIFRRIEHNILHIRILYPFPNISDIPIMLVIEPR